jgi:hypothetical protein
LAKAVELFNDAIFDSTSTVSLCKCGSVILAQNSGGFRETGVIVGREDWRWGGDAVDEGSEVGE